MVHVASSRRLHRVEAEDERVIFVVLGSRSILVFYLVL
jgi:hypothetical protein